MRRYRACSNLALPQLSVREFYTGRTILITGASSGIGRAMAERLAPMGARLILVARREAELNALASSLRSETAVFAHDLEPPGAARDLAGLVRERGFGVDVLVGNAGFGYAGPFLDHADDAVGMVDLNVRALTELTGAFLPAMVERGRGGVLNVASLAGFSTTPNFAVYGATKAYVLRFTEALHDELRGSGVHATALCPGPVATNFGGRSGLKDSYFDLGVPVEAVAHAGLAGLAKNKARVVPGLLTKIGAFSTRLVPGGLARRIGRAIVDAGR